MKHTLLSLSILIISSICFPSNFEPEFDQDKLSLEQQRLLQQIDSINTVYQLDYTDTSNFEREDWWPFCKILMQKHRALDSIKKDYFDAFILKPHLKKELSSSNKNMLKTISEELSMTFDQKYASRYEPEGPFFAILQLGDKPQGVYTSDKVKEVTIDGIKSYQPISKERHLVRPYENGVDYYASFNSKEPFRFNPGVLDTISFFQKEFFAYSGTTREKMSFVQFGEEQSECDPEYFYEVQASKKSKIGSQYQFDLLAFESTEINKDINKPICLDCPVSKTYEIFAKFRGVDHLYFVHTNEGSTPGAKLIMKMKDEFVTIWSNSSDQFGCACL